MTTKQRELLELYFDSEQLDDLSKIFELLQSEYAFELGVQTLKGVGLYDRLLNYLSAYYSAYIELGGLKSDIELLKYNFSYDYVEFEWKRHESNGEPTFYCIMNSFKGKDTLKVRISNKCEEILLPLFRKNFNIVFPNNVHIRNLKDISYPLYTIKFCPFSVGNRIIERTIAYKLFWDKDEELDYVPLNTQYLTIRINGHDPKRTLQLQDYCDLEELVIIGAYVDMGESRLPPNLKRITLYPTKGDCDGIWGCFLIEGIPIDHKPLLEQLESISIKKDLINHFEWCLDSFFGEDYRPQLNLKVIGLD